jgi:FkbM family methyltransferase
MYVAVFGHVRGNLIYVKNMLFPYAASKVLPKTANKMAKRRVTVMLPGGNIPLTMRAGTTDVRVFYEIFVNGEYEWGFQGAPQVIVDAGGYTGFSAAFFANKYPDATVITIEPDEENFALLKINTSRFPNVRAVQAAVWPSDSMLSLVDPGAGAWGLQVTSMDNAAPAEDKVIPAITIDKIIKEYDLDRIDLLKIDVEGSETEIFAAADSWISSVDTICIELHDKFKIGCSRSFFNAVKDFPIELRRNEDVLVARAGSRLAPLS